MVVNIQSAKLVRLRSRLGNMESEIFSFSIQIAVREITLSVNCTRCLVIKLSIDQAKMLNFPNSFYFILFFNHCLHND